MRGAVFVLLMFLFPATPSQARDWQVLTGPDRQGVESCPLPTGTEEPFFCVSLTCPAAGGQMTWALRFEGTALGDRELPVAISVDHGKPQVIRLQHHAEAPGVQAYEGTFDRKAHGLLLTRLAQGLKARLTLGEGAGAVSHTLGLTGSHRAITRLETLCPDPIVAAPGYLDHAAESPAEGHDTAPPQAGFAPYPGGYPPGHLLDAAEVRASLIGQDLSWSNSGGSSQMTFWPDGRLTGTSRNGATQVPLSGTWSLRPDGQLCWTTHASGCFSFRGAEDGLHVYRSDGGRALDLGRVSPERP